ncbi:MAG TPA: CpaD family pilus assembly lipoprotein, partial [Stellaceae bacterium]|nr:CpaD family pilus assembly lipoprotein [Stellaceae bacterium]
QAFLGADRRDSVGSVTIVGGDSAIADARRARVSQALDTLGLAHGTAPANPSFTADAVVVTANRAVALPPSCPAWAAIGSFDPSNGPINTLGCANSADLYLMVADPRDLVSGHPQGPADAAPSIAAVEAYRSGKASPSLGAADGAGGATTGGGGGGSTGSAGGGNGQ